MIMLNNSMEYALGLRGMAGYSSFEHISRLAASLAAAAGKRANEDLT
jgi:hypothetical protein